MHKQILIDVICRLDANDYNYESEDTTLIMKAFDREWKISYEKDEGKIVKFSLECLWEYENENN